jgi:putative transposase
MTHIPNQLHRRSIRLKGYDYSQEGLYFVTLCVQDRVCLFGRVENGFLALSDFGKIAQGELLKTNDIRPNVEIDSFVVMPNHVHFIVHIMRDAAGRGKLHLPEDENAIVQNYILHLPDEMDIDEIRPDEFNVNINQGECNLNVQSEFNVNLNRGECNLNVPSEFNVNINQGECNSNVQSEFNANINRGECNSPLLMPHGTSQTVGAIVRGYKSAVTKQLNAMGFTGKLWQRNYYETIVRTPESHERFVNYINKNPANWKGDEFHYQ